jgi:hypothetical protein
LHLDADDVRLSRLASTEFSYGVGRPALNLPVKWKSSHTLIVDIPLLPATATAVSGRRCCAACGQRRLSPASRSASTANASIPLRLYERLGFKQIADRGVYLFMEWLAAR